MQKVASILSHPEAIKEAVNEMMESDMWCGLLARMGGQLSQSVGEELGLDHETRSGGISSS